MILTLKSAVYQDWRPLSIALTYVATSALALSWKGAPLFSPSSAQHNGSLIIACVLPVLLTAYVAMLVRTRKESAISHSRIFLARHWETALRSAPLFLALVLFLPTFGAMKGSIFRFNDYGWDSQFIAWDQAIHGTDPWLLLQPYLGTPAITYAISVAYQLWLLLIYAGILIFVFRFGKPALREQFLCTYFLSWIVVGTVMAIIFASVGPCFAEPMLGIDRFVEQTRYVKSVEAHYPILVGNVQEMLLHRYQNRSAELGSGISAMPSMHVALACVYWLALRRLSRWLGYAGLAFLLIILIGSVHLGWHYAVDGYVSILVVIALWKIVGFWTGGDQR